MELPAEGIDVSKSFKVTGSGDAAIISYSSFACNLRSPKGANFQ